MCIFRVVDFLFLFLVKGLNHMEWLANLVASNLRFYVPLLAENNLSNTIRVKHTLHPL